MVIGEMVNRSNEPLVIVVNRKDLNHEGHEGTQRAAGRPPTSGKPQTAEDTEKHGGSGTHSRGRLCHTAFTQVKGEASDRPSPLHQAQKTPKSKQRT